MLLGNHSARFDSSGRIKIPEKFRSAIEEAYGKDVFITSMTGDSVQVYPMRIWENLTKITSQGLLHLKPDLRAFKLAVNRSGGHSEIDSKGRILISQELRERSGLDGEVQLIGLDDHFEIWNNSRLDDFLKNNVLSPQDYERISQLTLKGSNG